MARKVETSRDVSVVVVKGLGVLVTNMTPSRVRRALRLLEDGKKPCKQTKEQELAEKWWAITQKVVRQGSLRKRYKRKKKKGARTVRA